MDREAAARSVSAGLFIVAGSRDEADDEAGLMHLIEHMVFKGTSSRTAREIALTFDRLGAEVDAYTTKEYTAYTVKALPEVLLDAFDLLVEMVTRPAFPETELIKEKNVILEEIRAAEDAPDDLVHELAAAAAYGTHPLGRPVLGRRSVVRAADRACLVRLHRRFYRPERTVAVLAGAVSAAAIEKAAARLAAFGEAGAGRAPAGEIQGPDGETGPPAPETGSAASGRANGPAFEVAPTADGAGAPAPEEEPKEPPFAGGRRHRTRRELEQGHLVLVYPGLRAGHPDGPSWAVLNRLLGGSMAARLFQRIREDEGLVYDIYSYTAAFRDSGYLAVYAAMHPERAARVEALIAEEIRALIERGPGEEELEAAKRTLIAGYAFDLESTEARLERLAREAIYLGRHPDPETVMARYRAVSTDAVRKLAHRLLRPVGRAWVGPAVAGAERGGASWAARRHARRVRDGSAAGGSVHGWV
ncbi:pitrilysin family protein [Hydrogenibacillus schlegelii]|uniref:M16 family metallopeptidase n=1 Tax=Hydrogenibacillus schlegelii TaxID=1484 RepID=UPI00235772F3|nr:pitrilysin family protein [Hydrogenibacillus schlegelii]